MMKCNAILAATIVVLSGCDDHPISARGGVTTQESVKYMAERVLVTISTVEGEPIPVEFLPQHFCLVCLGNGGVAVIEARYKVAIGDKVRLFSIPTRTASRSFYSWIAVPEAEFQVKTSSIVN